MSTPSSNSSKGLPPWLVFLIAIIGPPAAFLPFAHSITQNPIVIAFMIVGYEILVFIGGFIGKVWLTLENPLVDHFSAWIQLQAQRKFSPFRHQYCQYLIYEHQVFDVKGLSTRTAHDLELEQVFVELSLDSTPAHQASSDPLRVPVELREGEHAIWDYLSSTSLGNPHLVIIGAPGSGKTTLLKHIALALAQQKKQPQQAKLSQTLPLLLFLRDQISSLQDNPDLSLVDAVQNHIQRKWHSSIPTSWIEYHLTHGQCLVLLDGLDEVADAATRRQVVTWVQKQMVAYGKNRFLLTSRPHGYRDNPLDGVTILEVHSFTPQQIERFIQRWYLANELKSWGKDDSGVHFRAREGAEDLLKRLQRAPALFELAVNPLLLTMIATVHRYRSSLPGKRVALYTEICEVFLGKRQEARGITQELTVAQKQQVLQALAYELMQRGMREIACEDAIQIIAYPLRLVSTQLEPNIFLQDVENTSGILLERNPGIYGFAHLTFQEYLAAVHIEKVKDEQILVDHVGDSWWHETIRLYCAQSDASALIAACLRGNPPSIPALTLATECQQEALKIQPEVRTQLEMLLEQGMEDENPERRHLIAEVLLARRMREMVPLSETVYGDSSLVTCAEYQLFLDEQRTRHVFCQPDHWQSAMFPSGKGRMPILGVRQADARAFCDWLSMRNTGGWHYRLPKKSECTEKDSEERQIEAVGYWTLQEGEFAWLRQPPRPPREKFEQLLSHDYTLLLLYSIINILDRDLALALDRAIASTRDLDRASANASALATNSASALNFDRTRDLARARDLASALASARTSALKLASDLAFDLDLASARDSILDLELARVLDRVRTLNLDLASALNLALALDLGRAYGSALTITGDPFFLKKELRDNIFKVNDRSHATETTEANKDSQSLKRDTEILHFYIRGSILVLVLILNISFWDKNSSQTWSTRLLTREKNQSQEGAAFQQTYEHLLSLYRDFALLELRIQGELPAWEGIFLVKEKPTSNQ